MDVNSYTLELGKQAGVIPVKVVPEFIG